MWSTRALCSSVRSKEKRAPPTARPIPPKWWGRCVVLGHDIFMNYMENCHQQGFDVSSFHFEAQWTVHMPVCIQGHLGRTQAFVVPGATPLLIGRPVLKAMKLQLNLIEDAMRVDEGPMDTHRHRPQRRTPPADSCNWTKVYKTYRTTPATSSTT